MKKGVALITGISGSGGSYLAEHLVKHKSNVKVHGISRSHTTTTSINLEAIANQINVHECDLNDYGSIIGVLQDVKPTQIYHLAANANVRTSFDYPLAFLQNNIMGTANLLDAIRRSGENPRFMMCSSSEVYGQVDPKNVPINEDCPINPSSPYSVSKIAQDLLGQTHVKSYDMDIVTTRMFTYINPRRSDLFATAFASQIARIESGKQEVLLHGNLDSVRTIIDVRDAMSAYVSALEKGKKGEVYNIGGEKTLKVGEFLDILKSYATVNIPSKVDSKLLRPADVTLQIPDTTKFRNETGWTPKYEFEETVGHLLNHCRERVKKE